MTNIIDVHSHALTTEFLEAHRRLAPERASIIEATDATVTLVSASGVRRGPFPRSFIDPEQREREMERDGVATHVLSAPPFMFLYDHEAEVAAEAIRILNDSLIAWGRANPDRYSVLASLPLQDVERSTREVERVAGERVVTGIAIGSSIQGVDLDDDALTPLWSALVRADLPVLIHPVDPPGSRLGRYFMRNTVGNPIETTIAASCLIFGGVLERFPALRFCLVHGGGFVPYQLGRLERGYEHRAEVRGRISRSPRRFLEQLFFDTILHDEAAIHFMAKQVGWEQVVIGSDYPFEMGDLKPRLTLETLATTVGQARIGQLASGNARRFLRTLA